MLPGLGRFLVASNDAPPLIVAVGATSTSTAYVATSTDGVTWTSQSVSGSQLLGVCRAPELGLYCAVGSAGLILTSPDGVTWTDRSIASAFGFFAVGWNGSLFAAVGSIGIYTSPDGTTWTSRTSPIGSGGYRSMTRQGGRLIAAGSDGSTGKAAYSDNGTSWTGANLSSVQYNGIGASGSVVVAVGNTGNIMTSADGSSWTSQTSGTSFALADVEWNGSLFCAVGTTQIRTSPDGATWTDRSGGTTRQLNGVVWTGTQFVVVGSSSGPLTPRVLTSSDGTSWTEQSIGLSSAGFNAVCI